MSYFYATFPFGKGLWCWSSLGTNCLPRSAVYENTEDGRFSVNYALSHDDGYTWEMQRTRLYTARNGKICGAPQGKPGYHQRVLVSMQRLELIFFSSL